MPWLVEAMKDVLGCDKPRGAAKKLDPGISEWDNPARCESCYHLRMGRTQGSETSQYLKEEKSIEIPGVAASETGVGRLVIAYLLGEGSGKFQHRG